MTEVRPGFSSRAEERNATPNATLAPLAYAKTVRLHTTSLPTRSTDYTAEIQVSNNRAHTDRRELRETKGYVTPYDTENLPIPMTIA